ncbi:MAG TPA: glycosyltransferase family 39 protein [Solirubrobacteraceae bacterium]|nr:glycosyltransferase family 39 protein [Solirubrobacteraceae bacterium]
MSPAIDTLVRRHATGDALEEGLGEAGRRRLPTLTPGQQRAAVAVYVVLLVVVSVLLRTRSLSAPFWADEGLSVGIAGHPLDDIPGALEKDGSPPLYYVLLHGWMSLAGTGEAATHVLSLVFATAFIPAALWAGWTIFGRTAGLMAATLAACNPFLGSYAQETRMYTLFAFLGLLCAAIFVMAFVRRRRPYVYAYAVAQALLAYTHNWGLFFGLAAAVVLVLIVWRSPPQQRRGLIRDGAIAFGGSALLYAPWLPTFLGQATSTGAPWATPPALLAPFKITGGLLGGDRAAIPLLLAGGVGLVALLRGPVRGLQPEDRTAAQSDEPGRRVGGHVRRAAWVLAGLAMATLGWAWLSSQFNPAWTTRYQGVVIGAILLVAAAGLSRAGRLGLVTVAAVALFWAFSIPNEALTNKSNADDIAAQVGARVRAGDVVISTQPEQSALLDYYLPSGLAYADVLGPVADPRVMDWRDALERMRATGVGVLGPTLDRLPVGRRLLLVSPITDAPSRWRAPWTSLVRRRSAQWGQAVQADRRLRVRAVAPGFYKNAANVGLRAVLYEKVAP